MAIRKSAVPGIVLCLASAFALASPAAAEDYVAKPTVGRAHVKVKLEIEKKGTVRELAIKDAEHIPLPDGAYTLTLAITTGLPATAIPVTLRHGEFKKIEFRQVGAGQLFSIAIPPTTASVSLAGAGGNFTFPAAPFRRD